MRITGRIYNSWEGSRQHNPKLYRVKALSWQRQPKLYTYSETCLSSGNNCIYSQEISGDCLCKNRTCDSHGVSMCFSGISWHSLESVSIKVNRGQCESTWLYGCWYFIIDLRSYQKYRDIPPVRCFPFLISRSTMKYNMYNEVHMYIAKLKKAPTKHIPTPCQPLASPCGARKREGM